MKPIKHSPIREKGVYNRNCSAKIKNSNNWEYFADDNVERIYVETRNKMITEFENTDSQGYISLHFGKEGDFSAQY